MPLNMLLCCTNCVTDILFFISSVQCEAFKCQLLFAPNCCFAHRICMLFIFVDWESIPNWLRYILLLSLFFVICIVNFCCLKISNQIFENIKTWKMSTPNENGTPSKRARNEGSGSQTPSRDPITPSRRTRAGSQQTPSQQRTPNRNRKFIKCLFSFLIWIEFGKIYSKIVWRQNEQKFHNKRPKLHCELVEMFVAALMVGPVFVSPIQIYQHRQSFHRRVRAIQAFAWMTLI